VPLHFSAHEQILKIDISKQGDIMSAEETKIGLPTEEELTQAIRIANRGAGAIHILCDMLDALREGRLEVKTYEGYLHGYIETPYKNIRIRKKMDR